MGAFLYCPFLFAVGVVGNPRERVEGWIWTCYSSVSARMSIDRLIIWTRRQATVE